MTEFFRAVRLRGPAELLQAVPYLLGFHPTDSLVLLGLAGGRLVVTARMDLADLAEPAVPRDVIEALARGGGTELIAAVYDGGPVTGPLPWSGLPAALAELCERCGCELYDVVRVAEGRWWSYLCDSELCCPPEGNVLPAAPSPFVADATYAGVVALPDRAALAATLDPLPERDRVSAEELRGARAALESGRAGARGDGTLVRSVLTAARRADAACAEWSLPRREVLRLGLALSSPAVRDAVWLELDDGELDGSRLWRELARRLPSPYSATPLFLLGWVSWRAGNGALAGIAADRAIASDPAYSAADLLAAILSHGLGPHQVPRLRDRRTGRPTATRRAGAPGSAGRWRR